MFSANYQTSSNWKKQQRAIRTINKILKQKKNKPISIQAQKLNNNKNNINKLLKNTTPPPPEKKPNQLS